MAAPIAALLLLGDGRFPAGGYAHSGGLEPAVTAGRVHDVASLEAFLEGRAAAAGVVAAAFAAAACAALAGDDRARVTALDAELDARIPSPAQRATSRQLGRQLLRVIGALRPDATPEHLPASPHHPVALGAAGAVFGLGRREVALLALHDAVAGPAAAAVRLLSLDPFSTHAALARLGPVLDELAREAAAASHGELDELPAAGSPLLDIGAEAHAARDVRLFAS